ncbi:sialate:O-sulfotransferase 2-like [Apostichopus japonicus]|uniref:sialate:O-sulfotransferase 2-like n=1 Tax=Stichopus japonicus TaxID=307972 RepID=UPI003AB66B61
MDMKSATQKITKYSWTGLFLILFMLYIVRNTHPDLSDRQSRPIKFQRDTVVYDVSPKEKKRKGSTNSGVAMQRRGNLLYPMVNVTNFPRIDDLDEEECQAMMDDVIVAPAYSMPLTALASFPRSGNTWTRSLLQVATGYSTGSVHWESERNRQRVQEWFLAGTEDYMRQTGVCVKTHEFSIDHIPIFNNGAIILIRNPYYSVVSDYFRFFGGLKNISRNQLVESMESRNDHWTKVLLPQFQRWKLTNINWINNCKRLLVVFFEDLERDPVRELTRMVTFLGQPLSPRRIMCAIYNFRPMEAHRSHMNFDPYTPEMHAILDSYIQEVNKTLLQKGGNPLPTYEKYALT